MADLIVDAIASFVQVADTAGRLVFLPVAMVQHFRRTGQTRITLEIDLPPESEAQAPVSATDAARLLMADVPLLSLDAAKKRVYRAMANGDIRMVGKGKTALLVAESLDAWRLRQRDAENDADDLRHGTSD